MSEWVDIPMATQQGEAVAGGASYVSDMELQNLMLVENPPGSRAPFHVAGAPVLGTGTGISSPAAGKFRGMCVRVSDARVFVIVDDEVWVGNNGDLELWTQLSGAAPGTEFCRVIDAGTHIVAVDGTNTFFMTFDNLSLTGTVSTGSRGDFCDVAYMDGYTFYLEAGSQALYSSNVDDPTTIDPLKFTTVDAVPGENIGLAALQRELFVFQTRSISHYYNDGSTGFPLARSSPGVISRGSWGPSGSATFNEGVYAISTYDNTAFWVGDDLRVYMMQGNQPVPISTPWAERFMYANLATGGSVNDGRLFGSAYLLQGSVYYTLSGFSISGLGVTQVSLTCDVKNRLWHTRRSSITGGAMLVNIVNHHNVDATMAERVLVARSDGGGTASGLFQFDPEGTNDSGGTGQLSRVMTLPQYAPASGRRTFMPELYVDMQKAAAATTATLSWSDDGGTTYSSGTAAVAANIPRLRWQRLGSFYQRILRLTFSVASVIKIMGVRARVEVGE